MESLTCFSCDDGSVNLYSCESCAIDSDECSNDIQKELLCDFCVAPHVKKGHDVRTIKGQLPMICDTHKVLHTLYCKTCGVSYCSKCSKGHSKHELGDIEERATELKKEVFEILTELELVEKPLRGKKKSIIEQKVCHESEQQQLKEQFFKEIDDLKNAGVKLIEKNCGLFSDKEATIVGTIDEAVDLQQKARNVLSLDNSMLINEFKELQDLSLMFRKVSKDVIAEEHACNSCSVAQLVNDFADFKMKLMTKMVSNVTSTKCEQFGEMGEGQQSINLGRLDVEEFSFGQRCVIAFDSNNWTTKEALFTHRLLIGKGELRIDQVELNRFEKIECTKELACLPFDKKVEAVYFDDMMSNVFVRTAEGLIIHVNKKEGSDSYVIQKEFPIAVNGLICPYVYHKQIHQCYWSSADRKVRFSHDKEAVFSCSVYPTLISPHVYPFFYFLKKKDILIYDTALKEQYKISFNVHKVESVDRVNLYCTDGKLTIFLWSESSKSITKLTININETWNVNKLYWTHPTSYLMDRSGAWPNFRFLPAVREDCNDEESEYRYIYAVFDDAGVSQ